MGSGRKGYRMAASCGMPVELGSRGLGCRVYAYTAALNLIIHMGDNNFFMVIICNFHFCGNDTQVLCICMEF